MYPAPFAWRIKTDGHGQGDDRPDRRPPSTNATRYATPNPAHCVTAGFGRLFGWCGCWDGGLCTHAVFIQAGAFPAFLRRLAIYEVSDDQRRVRPPSILVLQPPPSSSPSFPPSSPHPRPQPLIPSSPPSTPRPRPQPLIPLCALNPSSPYLRPYSHLSKGCPRCRI